MPRPGQAATDTRVDPVRVSRCLLLRRNVRWVAGPKIENGSGMQAMLRLPLACVRQ